MFVTHWRTYLFSRSLGSSWLDKYASRVDPTLAWPSRGRKKTDTRLDPVPAKIRVPSKLSTDSKPLVDTPLDSGSDDDSEGDANGADTEGEDLIDSEDIFADD